MTDARPLTKEQSRLAERGVPIAAALSRVFAREWTKISLEDFVSVGHEAAVTAARSFDPARGASFETFAHHRIHGAMLDIAVRELRRARLLRDNLMRTSAEKWIHDPSIDEMLEAPDPSRADLVRGLMERTADLLAGTIAGGTDALTGEDGVIELLEDKRIVLKLRAAVQALDREDRQFVRLYYEEGLSPDDVAGKLGVTRRTVFRMQERVRAKLAEALIDRG